MILAIIIRVPISRKNFLGTYWALAYLVDFVTTYMEPGSIRMKTEYLKKHENYILIQLYSYVRTHMNIVRHLLTMTVKGNFLLSKSHHAAPFYVTVHHEPLLMSIRRFHKKNWTTFTIYFLSIFRFSNLVCPKVF